jgi:AcrR family transcriptional regulator
MSAKAVRRRPVRSYGGVSADERVAQRHARLLEAGLEEFGTRGVLSTGVKDICRRAGLTDRYFYESFRDSGELFAAVFDHATAHLFELVAGALAGAPPAPPAQARAVIEAYVHALADDPRLARVVFVEAPSAGPEVERHIRHTLRRFARLAEAAARPYLPATVPDKALRFGAVSLVGAIERLMVEWQDGELGLSVQEIIDYLVALLLGAGLVAERSGTQGPHSAAQAKWTS